MYICVLYTHLTCMTLLIIHCIMNYLSCMAAVIAIYNNNNNIIFYSANIQVDKNLFSVLSINCVCSRTCKLKITYITSNRH